MHLFSYIHTSYFQVLYLQFCNLKTRYKPTVRAPSPLHTFIRTHRNGETPRDTAISLCKSLHNFFCEHILSDSLPGSGISPNVYIINAVEHVSTCTHTQTYTARHTRTFQCTHTYTTQTHAYSWLFCRLPKRKRDAAATGTTNYLPAMTAGDLCPPSAFSHTCKVKASRGSSISAFSRS